VKKVAKSILTGLGGALVLAGIVLLLINVYLQSAAVQNKIQQSLGEAFDVPIEIRTISFMPPGGLKLSGIAVPSGDESSPFFLRAVSVTVRFRLSPLFRHRFVIQDITVRNPIIHWKQSPRGKWQPPTEKRRETPEFLTEEPALPLASESPSLPETPERPEATETPEAPEAARELPPEKGPRFEVHVQHFNIQNGNIQLRDRDGDPLVDFTGINIGSDWSSSKNTATGKARARETRIVDSILLEKLSTKFKSSPDALQLRQIDAKIGGGNLAAEFDAILDDPQLPFRMSAEFSDVELSQLLADAGVESSHLSGKMTGKLKLRGGMRDRDRATGEGFVSVEGGSFRQYGILQMIGDQLRIRELSELELEQATAKFRVHDGKVLVDDLVLKSPNIKIQVKGTVKLNGRLKLDARLTINDTISRQLPGFIEDNFTRIKDSDHRYVDFDITGTVDAPDTELMRAILWKKHEEAAKQIFRQIFGGPGN
jgi:type II secretion system protein N